MVLTKKGKEKKGKEVSAFFLNHGGFPLSAEKEPALYPGKRKSGLSRFRNV